MLVFLIRRLIKRTTPTLLVPVNLIWDNHHLTHQLIKLKKILPDFFKNSKSSSLSMVTINKISTTVDSNNKTVPTYTVGI